MNTPGELTVPQAVSYLGVSEETICRNIMSKRLRALRGGVRVVRSTRISCDTRQQLRLADWTDTADALIENLPYRTQ